MSKRKVSPILIISSISIFVIILFLIIGASGFRGLIPGSNLFNNKSESGYYVFYRILEELQYDIEFESYYTVPDDRGKTIVYLDINENETDVKNIMTEWVKRGNHLILFDEAVNKFFGSDAVETRKNKKIFTTSFIKKLKDSQIIKENDQGIWIIKIMAGKGSILLISDSRPFNNSNMHEVDNAIDLDKIFYDYRKGPIFLREKYSEAMFDPTLIKGLFKGKLSIITIHAIVIFFILLLINGKRFSKPSIREGKKVRKITEHIAAMGLFYQKAGAAQLIEKSDSQYFKWVICRNKKPSSMDSKNYLLYSEYCEDLSEEEIVNRFKNRNVLIKKIRSRNSDN